MMSYRKYPPVSVCILAAAVFSCDDGPSRPREPATGSILFAAAVVLDAGDSPMSVFSCDLDGDGDNDLAVATTSPDYVARLFNLARYP
jgi:hypothetical protein